MTPGDDKRDPDLHTTPHRFHRRHAIWWTLFAILAMLLTGAYAYGELRSAITLPPKHAALTPASTENQ